MSLVKLRRSARDADELTCDMARHRPSRTTSAHERSARSQSRGQRRQGRSVRSQSRGHRKTVREVPVWSVRSLSRGQRRHTNGPWGPSLVREVPVWSVRSQSRGQRRQGRFATPRPRTALDSPLRRQRRVRRTARRSATDHGGWSTSQRLRRHPRALSFYVAELSLSLSVS